MKKRKILVLLLCLFCLTGCTKMLKDGDNKVVRNEKTGQTITENVIWRPTDKSTLVAAINEVKQTIQQQENVIFTISPNDWILNNDTYEYNYNHGLNSLAIHATFIDASSGESVIETYVRIDANNIKIISDNNLALQVILSANYFNMSGEVNETVGNRLVTVENKIAALESQTTVSYAIVTQAQYDTLVNNNNLDPRVLYLITD